MRTHGPAVFPGARALHLDDIGAQIREDHARRRTSHYRAEVEDAYSSQYAGHAVKSIFAAADSPGRRIHLSVFRISSPMGSPADVASAMREQSDWCEQLGSPFYRALLSRIADDVRASGVCWRVLEQHAADPARFKLPLRFLAAIH